jgi:hypothetical protein
VHLAAHTVSLAVLVAAHLDRVIDHQRLVVAEVAIGKSVA